MLAKPRIWRRVCGAALEVGAAVVNWASLPSILLVAEVERDG